VRKQVMARAFAACLIPWGAIGCSAPLVRDLPLLSPDDPHFEIEHRYPVESEQFQRAIGTLLGPSILPGNEVETLVNGDQIFPAMLDAIRSAKRSVTFETYVFSDGEIADQFTSALTERARAGVPVKIILDALGKQKFSSKHISELSRAGADVHVYNPLAWYDPFRWEKLADAENRTHRKILVVDGRIGFTGGAGVADFWKGNAESPDHWRETHYRLRGPAVAQLQSAFVDNWLESGGELLHDRAYFPDLSPVGSVRAQVFKSSPAEATANVELMIRISIAAAARSIKLSSAYFAPDPGTIEALIQAARRGVQVEIIVPGEHNDSVLVKAASPALWGRLLENGVAIHRYEPTMFHCKVLVIDDFFSSVGSTNFDNRSFRLNDEVNLNVFDADFSRRQAEIFEADKRRSERLTFEQWRQRPWHEKAKNWLVARFRREL
jgi:cardiolipin synthase